MKKDNKVLNMQMPKNLYEKLKALAEKKNISLASLVKIITTEYLEKEGK
jgi:predicted DNA-binding protein